MNTSLFCSGKWRALQWGTAACAILSALSLSALTLEVTNDAVLIEARERALVESAKINEPSSLRQALTGEISLTEWGPDDTNVFISIRDCIAMGLERNLGLVISRYDPSISEEDVRKAWSMFDPTYNMGFTWSGSKSPRPYDKEGPAGNFKHVMGNSRSETVDFHGGFTGLLPTGMRYDLLMGQDHSLSDPGGDQYNPAYHAYNQGTLTVPVLKNFGLGVNMAPIRVARNSWRIARVTLEASVQDLILNITTAYWALYYTREDLSAQEYALKLAKELLKVNEAKVRVGMAAPLDVTQAKASIASQEEVVLLARKAVLNAEDILRQIINYEMAELFKPKALRSIKYHLVPLEKPKVIELPEGEGYFIEQALNNQQTIEIAQLSLKNAAENLKVAKNGLLPEVNLIGSLGFNSLGDDYGHAYDDQYSGQHPQWSMGVEMTVPLLYLEPVATYRQARYAKQQAEITVEQTRQTVVMDVRKSLRAVETNRKRIDTTREASLFAREQLQAEEEKFKVGQSTTFDVLYYQNQLATALRNEIRALADWRVSVTALYRSTGRILTDSNIVIEDSYGLPEPSNTLANRIWY